MTALETFTVSPAFPAIRSERTHRAPSASSITRYEITLAILSSSKPRPWSFHDWRSMNLEEFHEGLLNDTDTEPPIEQTFTSEAFLAELADRLAEAEEIEQLSTLMFEGEGRRKRKLAVHGFDLDDSDNSIALAVLRFRCATHWNRSASPRRQAAEGTECVLGGSSEGVFTDGREESTPGVPACRRSSHAEGATSAATACTC